MKKLILVLIGLLVFPSFALAAKGGKPPEVDYQALIDQEESARIAADENLQFQIENIDAVYGQNGLSCWDLDGDDVADSEEDINKDGVWDALDCRAPEGSTGISGSVYRWNVFSTFHQASNSLTGWYANDNASMFGGISPSTWGDGSGKAFLMSPDKEVLRTLLTRKGYGGKNATVVADEWYSYSSTNSKHAVVLFRVKNTTVANIVWPVSAYLTAYAGWGEVASVAVNGVNAWNSAGASLSPGYLLNTNLTIPADRTSTIIFVASSSVANNTRSLFLGFTNDCLELPAGLEYVDDLDTATGGWTQ
jgi:hypothetical protein